MIPFAKASRQFATNIPHRSLEAPSSGPATIRYRDEGLLEEKIMKMKNKPFNVFTDFDHTLTRNYVNDKMSTNSVDIFLEPGVFPEPALKQLLEADKKYLPIFTNYEMPREEKHVAIVPWWRELHSEIIRQRFSKERFKEVVLNSHFYFRFGIIDFFKTLSKYDVNLLISSAGILAIVREFVELLPGISSLKKPLYFGTLEKYNTEGDILEFQDPIITMLNKSSQLTHENCTYIPKGSNAIVMGDNITDLYMIERLELGTVISIGYYNEHSKIPLEKLIKEFDIIIEKDGDLTFVNELINRIAS